MSIQLETPSYDKKKKKNREIGTVVMSMGNS